MKIDLVAETLIARFMSSDLAIGSLTIHHEAKDGTLTGAQTLIVKAIPTSDESNPADDSELIAVTNALHDVECDNGPECTKDMERFARLAQAAITVMSALRRGQRQPEEAT